MIWGGAVAFAVGGGEDAAQDWLDLAGEGGARRIKFDDRASLFLVACSLLVWRMATLMGGADVYGDG